MKTNQTYVSRIVDPPSLSDYGAIYIKPGTTVDQLIQSIEPNDGKSQTYSIGGFVNGSNTIVNDTPMIITEDGGGTINYQIYLDV